MTLPAFSFIWFFMLHARFAPAVTAPLAEKTVFTLVLLTFRRQIGNINQAGNPFYFTIGHKKFPNNEICRKL
jgi:hypothetical protein